LGKIRKFSAGVVDTHQYSDIAKISPHVKKLVRFNF